jgi:formyltetrahydrofolate deformylase
MGLSASADRAILTGHCRDKEGLVAGITGWIFRNGGNILHLDQHVDPIASHFFIRVEWDLVGFAIPKDRIAEAFRSQVAEPLDLEHAITFSSGTPKMAIFVSREGHCLWDILARCASGEWNVEVPLIISNHPDFERVARYFGIDYRVFPITPDNKAAQERKQLEALDHHRADFVVLARYMQILSAEFVARHPNRIINIHHSFLPAFAGSRPYHQAYDRGVKLIGATAHYVTADLDQGPIIEQDTARVSHRDSVQDMIRLGRDLEKVVLSRAIFLHLNRQVIVHGKRTVVFT